MSAFDKVIGYRATKQELLQICDMLRDRTIYEEMGARMPHGLLLYGEPGLGKTLLAKCFLAESGLNTITVRRDKGGDAFIDSITQAFAKATAEAPAIVFLDDMDKFANEDSSRCDAPEYVAVQAGIDTVPDHGPRDAFGLHPLKGQTAQRGRVGLHEAVCHHDAPPGPAV